MFFQLLKIIMKVKKKKNELVNMIEINQQITFSKR